MHLWLIQVYKKVLPHIFWFFIIFSKLFFFILFIKNFNFILLFSDLFSYVFFIVGFFTVGFGVFCTLIQIRVVKFLSFSSISFVGFLFLLLSLSSVESFVLVLYYVCIYSFLLLNLFLIFSFLIDFSIIETFFFSLDSIKSKLVLNVTVLYFFIFVVFSFLGLPPFIGFFPKIFFLMKFLQQQAFCTFFFFIVLNFIASFYYLRLIIDLFFVDSIFENFVSLFYIRSFRFILFIVFLNVVFAFVNYLSFFFNFSVLFFFKCFILQFTLVKKFMYFYVDPFFSAELFASTVGSNSNSSLSTENLLQFYLDPNDLVFRLVQDKCCLHPLTVQQAFFGKFYYYNWYWPFADAARLLSLTVMEMKE